MKTKRKIDLVFILFFSCILFLQYGCKKEKEDLPSIPGLNEYILNDNVIILDSLYTPDPIIEGEKYTFNYTTTPPDFKVGDIIIGYTNGGYIMKVTSIEKSQKSTDFVIILYVIQALFEEVFSDCNFDISIPIISNETSLDNTILYDQQIGNVDLEVIIQEGFVNTDFELNFKLVRVDGETLLFGLIAEGDIHFESQTNFIADGQVNHSDETLILPPFSTGFMIGGIVPAQIFLGFYGGFNAKISAEGAISYKCSTNGEIEFGAEYANSEGWNEVWEKGGEFTNEEINWNMNIDATTGVYVKPELKLLICGIAGPIMNVQSYLNFNANVNYPQWAWELNGGYRGNIGFELNALGFFEIIVYSTPLVQWETQIDFDEGQIIPNNEVKNVALSENGGIASAISEGTYMGDTQFAYEAIDGDENNGWSSSWDMPAWHKVEFNQIYGIDSIGIWWGSHQHDYSVSLSEDGNNWTVVITGLSNNYEGSAPVYELFPINSTNAKYMKIDITSTSAPSSHIFQASVNEIEAFAKTE